MTTYQRIAWLELGLCIAALAAIVALGMNLGWTRALAGSSVLGLVGLLYVPRLHGSSGKVFFDERDREIMRFAGTAAFGVVWVAVFLGGGLLMLSGSGIWPSGAIPIGAVPWLLVGLAFVFLISKNTAVLLCCRKAC